MTAMTTIKPLVRKNLVRHPYRSHLGIISDILCAVMESGRQGIIITTLARRSNLSHNMMVNRCQELINAGLIESRNVERGNAYIVTEKGIEFFHQAREFIEIAQELQVRL